ncbi:MAG: alanine racemase [Alphaproteobacteria bacterium]|nr:alanine racemase [Alphaproteobacteria bacterium]
MSILTRPILEINLDNIVKNYKLLHSISPKAIAAAVVKDDAYGIGAEKVADKLYSIGCHNFFVAHGIEGEKIRPFVGNSDIFVLQGIGEDSLESFKKAKLTPVIANPQQFEFWKNNKIKGIKPLIQIETGLNRLGFREEELEQLSEDDKKEFSVVLSHLACGDEKEHFMNEHQLLRFNELKERFFPKQKATLSASDGTFLGESFQKDMVRLGAAMYGINTAPYRTNQMLPCIKIVAPVLDIAKLKKGDFVGYSVTYRAATDRKIAIVSIGYGDGIPRSLSNKGKVFFNVNNKIQEARILGRISMDNIICDVTDVENLQIGDMAEIINDFYTLDDIGRDAGTIGYEILSRIGKNPRFIRNYIG